ncbi:MAG: YeiH family protein [Bacillota bacterium]
MSRRESALSYPRMAATPGIDWRPLLGVLLLAIVGYAGKVAASHVPHTEYVIFAIAFGMVICNTIRIPAALAWGIRTYEFWLRAGIVLMGAGLQWQNVLKIGATGLALIAVEILVAVFVARVLARVFGLSEKLGSLMGVGVGICGVSAIIGATGAIDARDEEAGYAIATVLIFGAIMVFLFPFLGKLMHLSDQAFGFWAGLSVDNTAETIATGFAYSEGAGQVATLVKLSRNALMGFVILLFALYYAARGQTREIADKAKFLWSRFPKFLLGFLALSLLSSAGFFTPTQVKTLTNLSKWFFMLTFAGVGLSLSLSRMKAGLKPFLVGLGVESAVAIITLVLILVFI